MGDERWSTVWELFSCVYDMPAQERAAFLESNAPVPEVRGQVLALLEVSQSCTQEGSVFPPPAPGPEYPVGHQLGRYMIVGLIGQGGFGRIYAAHDKDLKRVVALKVLSRPLVGNRARQIEEARAASALNHPNIVTVYEAISADDHVAIAMEFVDGQSLRQMLNETAGPVAIEKVIRYGRQMAEALKAAHEAGITHGDVKPENILVRKDQYVKLVDFGLATNLVASPETGAAGLTGTLRYISPEQLRGEPSSRASDIFALGLVLYEMTAGMHAFPGKTPLDAAEAIAATHPLAPSRKAPHIPPQLDRLIVAMLHKDPRARPAAEQVARALEQPKTTLKTGWVWSAALAAAFLAAALLAWFVVRKNDSPDFSDLKIQPLTSQWGWEGSPALSPDGKSVAFTWSDRLDSPEQIYLKVRGAEHQTRLTAPKRRDRIGSLVWSPDGKRIAFKRSAQLYQHPGAIYSVSREGGNEQKLLELSNGNLSSSIDWSPDGTQLAYSDASPNPDQLAIYLFNLQTRQKRRLTSPPKGIWGDWDPRFSPDGTRIAFKRVRGLWADDIYVTEIARGSIRRVATGAGGIFGHAWTADGKNLIVSCQRGSTIHGLWRFPLMDSDGAPQRLVQGAADATTPATNRKTNVFAFVNQFKDLNIYRVSAKGTSRPEKLIASTLSESQGAYSSTSRIAFVSDRSGSREIWIADPDNSVQTRVTAFNGSLVEDPEWSHDGRRLACKARTNGIPRVFTLNCSRDDMHCDAPVQFPSSGSAEAPSWSADDRFLYFASERSGRLEIYKKAVDGGPLIQVTHNGGYVSRESLDGRWLYFSNPQKEGVWRMSLAASPGKSASAEELVFGSRYHPTHGSWTLAGDEIVFIDQSSNNQPAAIRAYNIVTHRIRLIQSLTPSFFENNETRISVSSDLQWVLYSQVDEVRSNVMVAESVRSKE